MPVHVSRKRAGIWYARGTVKVGSETRIVSEYSTGCPSRADAEGAARARDEEIRQELLGGPSARARRVTIADCLLAYVDRPGGLRPYDRARVDEFNNLIGDRPVTSAAEAWQTWLAVRGAGQKPSSVARWRATLQAALNHGATAYGLPAPRLPGVKGGGGEERLIYLTDSDRRKLIAAYNPHAACPALLLAYQGMRSQEALQLDWRQVNFERREIWLPPSETKTGKGRTVPMHRRVDALLYGMWCAAGQPERGAVFLSAKRRPYTDTRGRGEDDIQGGNPLASAHGTACRKAGVSGFRVHDWRHDWASRMVMHGTDLRTLMDLGGWKNIRMVQRYAAVGAQHMADAVARLG